MPAYQKHKALKFLKKAEYPNSLAIKNILLYSHYLLQFSIKIMTKIFHFYYLTHVILCTNRLIVYAVNK